MLTRLLGRRPNRNREITDSVYAQIVASARQQRFFRDWGVPDSPLGRFEMLGVHVFLFLHRTRSGDAALTALAQDLTDEFFKDVDHSLRELGIGDMGVPRRMKKLARMFYGRAQAFGAALDADDHAGLAAALARNLRPEATAWPQAHALARYMTEARDLLGAQADADLLEGRIAFPLPGGEAG